MLSANPDSTLSHGVIARKGTILLHLIALDRNIASLTVNLGYVADYMLIAVDADILCHLTD